MPSDRERWRDLTALADRLAPRLARAFRAHLDQLRDRIDADHVLAAVRAGDVETIVAMLQIGDEAAAASIREALASAIGDAGQALRGQVPTRPAGAGLPVLAVEFDRINPRVIQAAERNGLELIREITESTRQGVRQFLTDGVRTGRNPIDTARQVRQVIGLTARQAQAVANYRRFLETGQFADALNRQLRDRRFDSSVVQAAQQQAALSQEKVDRMVERYRERYIKYRSEVIARTESLRAVHIGNQELWRQAVEQGVVDRTLVRRRWFVAPDEKVCPICSPIPGMNNEPGLTLEETFRTPAGPMLSPPAHPQCRCTVFHRIVEPEFLEVA